MKFNIVVQISILTLFLLLKLNLRDFHYISMVRHVHRSDCCNTEVRRMNIRTTVGDDLLVYPGNTVVPVQHCHTTEVNVTLPVIADYTCERPIYGRVIYLDSPLPNGANAYGFDVAEVHVFTVVLDVDTVSKFVALDLPDCSFDNATDFKAQKFVTGPVGKYFTGSRGST